MSENYDVASRLAQGRSAVDTVQQYVWASHQLGYQHQDLTLHPSQVVDWYRTEDGMDLGALHRGWLALDAATRAAHDALDVQDRQSAPLSAGWQGAGGLAARDFLRRHGDASAAVAAAVRTAAEALATLREGLWQAVGAKVDTAVAVEARAAGARAEWLAAATTVTTGAGDRSTASELVDTAVKPFVDNDIRGDWLVGMQQSVTAVTAAYERALREIEGEPAPVFDVPGDFGPACGGDQTPTAPACAGPICAGPICAEPEGGTAATAPSAWSAPAVPAPVAAPTPSPALPTQAPAPLPFGESAASPAPVPPPAAPSPLGAMGSAMPDMGGGLAGLGQQFADTLSGLLGGAEGGLPDLPDTDLDGPNLDEDLGEPDEDIEDIEDEEDEEGEEGLEDDAVPAEEVVADEAVVEEVAVDPEAEPEQGPCEAGEQAAPAATPAPAPAQPPPAEPLPPPAGPVVAEQTPCEIAADEVPQVGEPAE